MVKMRIRESLEVGNRITGYYRRWEKESEFEGSAQEVSYLVSNLASRLMLPGVSLRGGSNDNMMIDRFNKLLQLEDK